MSGHSPSEPEKTEKVTISRETASIALAAIKLSQEQDYYHTYEKAQQELEALL